MQINIDLVNSCATHNTKVQEPLSTMSNSPKSLLLALSSRKCAPLMCRTKSLLFHFGTQRTQHWGGRCKLGKDQK